MSHGPHPEEARRAVSKDGRRLECLPQHRGKRLSSSFETRALRAPQDEESLLPALAARASVSELPSSS